jgi:nucleoid DNA-binding protein
MTHTEVIEYLAEHLKQSKSEIRGLLRQTTEVLKEILDREDSITLPRLGTFHVKKRQKRRGFHPRRKQYMILPPRRVVSFHASQSLRDRVKDVRIEK